MSVSLSWSYDKQSNDFDVEITRYMVYILYESENVYTYYMSINKTYFLSFRIYIFFIRNIFTNS